MNGFRLVSAILSCVFVGFTAQAIPYTDLDIIGVKLSDSNPTYSGTFNILQTGYNPLSQHLVSASAWFGFGDDYSPIQDVQDLSGYKEVVKVDVGLMQGYFGPVEVDFSTILGGGLSGSLLMDLSSDGILTYKINKVSGDFYVGYAKVVAEADSNQPRSVPDGGNSLILPGLGMVPMYVLNGRIGRRRTNTR